MNATPLEPNSFTRERVKSRMLRRAAELWGYSAPDSESFDPLVSLLLEACAVEFEKIDAEIRSSQNRLLDRVAQLLHPEPAFAKPASGIAQIRSADPRSMVYSTTQLSGKRTGINRYDSAEAGADQTYFFSPVGAYPIVDGAVRYLATSQALFRIEEGNQKLSLARSNAPMSAGPHQSLWLGLELDDAIPSLDGLTFFFDSATDTPITWLSDLLFSQWRLGNQPLTMKSGWVQSDPATALSPLEAEFDPMHKLEKEVLAHWNSHFITVAQSPLFQSAGMQRQPYPAVFSQWFADRDLRAMREPLWWIEVQLSHLTPPEVLADTLCGLNCFPVLNRRLHRITYRLQKNLNIIPLETDQSFLMVREVRTSEGHRLTSVALDTRTDEMAGTYTIQNGVSRFDSRNARQVLTNLQDLVRDESASFAALGEDFLSSLIRELNQTLARLEAKVDQKTTRQEPLSYLLIQPRQPGDTVFIEYWTSHGEAANRLLAGSRLSSQADPSLRKDSAYLMTKTTGGRQRPGEAQKINQYKRALLSRGRIVTLEDARIACLTELGNLVQSVQVERTFRVHPLPFNGFERCIRVCLTPVAESDLTAPEWMQRTESLRLNLEAQSVAAIPYEIVLSTQ